MFVAGVVGHGLLDFLVGTERDFFHFSEIPAALRRGHGLADGDEMPEHLPLALCAEFAQFGQFFLGSGGDPLVPLASAAWTSAFLAAMSAHILAHCGR